MKKITKEKQKPMQRVNDLKPQICYTVIMPKQADKSNSEIPKPYEGRKGEQK